MVRFDIEALSHSLQIHVDLVWYFVTFGVHIILQCNVTGKRTKATLKQSKVETTHACDL